MRGCAVVLAFFIFKEPAETIHGLCCQIHQRFHAKPKHAASYKSLASAVRVRRIQESLARMRKVFFICRCVQFLTQKMPLRPNQSHSRAARKCV